MESQPRFNRARVWNICAAVVVLGLALSSIVQDSFHRSYRNNVPPGVPLDFPHYYMAGRLARLKPPANLLYYPPVGYIARSYTELRTDATTPYGSPSSGGGLPDRPITLPFDAPPFSALVMEPLAFLPWQAAYFVWQLLCVFMMMASLYFALRLPQDRPPSMLVMTIGLGVVFLFSPFRQALALGNIDVFLLFLWVLGGFFLRRGRVIASASCFALGTAIKVSPVFAFPLLAMRRQWRWLASYGVVSTVLLALSVWRVGWWNHVVWAGQVAPALSLGIKWFGNRSLPGFIFGLGEPQRLLTALPGPPGLCLFNKALSVGCYSAFLTWCWRQRRDSKGLLFEIILLPLIVLLVSPISWTQYYVLAVLPLTYLWLRSREQAVAVSKLDLILLTGSTLTFGSALPEYDVARALGPSGGLLVMGAWVAATLALLWVGMRMYKSCVADGRRAAPDLSTRCGCAAVPSMLRTIATD